MLHVFKLRSPLYWQDLLRLHSTDWESVYSCNCAKDEQKRLSIRRYAGVFVTVLPCGHIVTLHHLLGAESLRQSLYLRMLQGFHSSLRVFILTSSFVLRPKLSLQRLALFRSCSVYRTTSSSTYCYLQSHTQSRSCFATIPTISIVIV